MQTETLVWWSGLCAVSALNLLAWAASAARVRRGQPGLPDDVQAVARLQLLLSGIYVLGCGYRSVLPVFDVQRLCLVDSVFSSVAVGRSVATLAELCFAAQWALLLRSMARATGNTLGLRISQLLVPLIVVAELFSWRAVLTTSNLGHVVEESLWGLCGAFVAAGLLLMRPQCAAQLRPLVASVAAASLGYAVYMFGVDVPMYWARWVADEAQGRPYLDVWQGLADASGRWVVSHRWEDWKSEVLWMSLYFSVAVWFSIALIHAPVPWRRALVHRP